MRRSLRRTFFRPEGCGYARGISHVSAKHFPHRTPSKKLYRCRTVLTSLICTWITATFWHFSSLLSWSILRIVHCLPELMTQSSCAPGAVHYLRRECVGRLQRQVSCAQPSLRWHSPCLGTYRPARLAWDFVFHMSSSSLTHHYLTLNLNFGKVLHHLSSLCVSRYATSSVQSSLGRNPYNPLSPEGIHKLLNTFGFLFYTLLS